MIVGDGSTKVRLPNWPEKRVKTLEEKELDAYRRLGLLWNQKVIFSLFVVVFNDIYSTTQNKEKQKNFV